ncbi:MAG: hypothetical protein VB092_09135 [Oscillospiraceae bacterium]|nr:hypothetical protein [Oscillospiraceae bacterium]
MNDRRSSAAALRIPEKVKSIWKRSGKKITAAAGALAILLFVGLFVSRAVEKANAPAAQARAFAVQVEEIRPKSEMSALEYVGSIEPETIQQETYESISTVENIYVEVGDAVNVGDPLVQMNTENAEDDLTVASNSLKSAESARNLAQSNLASAQTDLNDAKTIDAQITAAEQARDTASAERQTAQSERTAAQTSLSTAQTELDAAKNASPPDQTLIDQKQAAYDRALADYNAKQTTYNEKDAAYNSAAAQVTTLNAKKTNMDNIAVAAGYTDTVAYYQNRYDTASSNYADADSTYQNAKINYDSAAQALGDCTLRATITGYVMQVTVNEGGVAVPLYPVVVVGSYGSVVSFGVSASDVRSLTRGMACTSTVGGVGMAGEVTDIGVVPDEDSRTYDVRVSLPDSDERYMAGEIVRVRIETGALRGTWLSVGTILNDGDDYVFVVEDGRAVKKRVKILQVANDLVCVSGLEAGGSVIVDGMKSLKSGNFVTIVE